MRKVLIFYATYGGGHLSAAKSIKEFFEENYDSLDVKMIDCMEYINKFINKITVKAYCGMAKKAPWMWGKVYYNSQKGLLGKVSCDANKLMARKMNKLLEEEKPDIIVSTHPFSSQMCAYLKKNGELHAKIATVMTDYVPHDQWLVDSEYIDYYFVAHYGMKEELMKKCVDEFKIFSTGIPVSPRFLNPTSTDSVYRDFGLSKNKKTILFFAGGEFGFGKKKVLETLQALAENFKDIQVIAIAGRNEKIKEQFTQIVSSLHKEASIKVLSYTSLVPEFMSLSDLVITKPGGLTVTESLISSLPLILINPLPGQEAENAEFLLNKKVAVLVRKNDDVKEVLEKVINNDALLQEMKENTISLAKRNSTKDICEILLKN